MSDVPALEARAVGVRLGGKVILHDVTLDARAGEVLGVFGPSGAGKSTLFRALTGEERQAAGSVRLAGEDVTSLPLWQRARRGLGYVPQTPSVLWDLTVAENLAVFRGLRAPGDLRARAADPEALLAELGLEGRAGVRASALSGGERRRLEIARALTAAPRVLICDEPFAAIDPIGSARAAAVLRRLAREEGAAVVLADHHVALALQLCDRAALLLGGEIAAIAEPAAFLDLPLVQQHYATGEPAPPRDIP